LMHDVLNDIFFSFIVCWFVGWLAAI
jgi:hypothetical protein